MAERLLLIVPEHMRRTEQPRPCRRALTIAEMEDYTLQLIVINMTELVEDAPFHRSLMDQSDLKKLAECDLALSKNLELLAEAKLELIRRGLDPKPLVAAPLAS